MYLAVRGLYAIKRQKMEKKTTEKYQVLTVVTSVMHPQDQTVTIKSTINGSKSKNHDGKAVSPTSAHHAS